MGRLSPHSLYLALLPAVCEAVFCHCSSVFGLGTWSPSCYDCLTLTCLCTFFLHPFCTPRANENWCKTIWCVAGVIYRPRAWSCCTWLRSAQFYLLCSVRPARSFMACRNYSALAWLKKEKWACEVQASIEPLYGKQLLSLKQMQETWTKRQSNGTQVLVRQLRCEVVSVSRVKTSGGKGEVVSLL